MGSRAGLASSPVLCALRLGAPPGHLGSDARSDPNHPARASSSDWVAAPACDWHRSSDRRKAGRVVSGRRSSACSSRSPLRLTPPCACDAADAFLSVHLLAARPSGLTARTTSPSCDAWRPPGQGGGRPRRAIDACASRSCRRLLSCNQRFSMSTRESLRFPLRSRGASFRRLGPDAPLRFASRCVVVLGRRRRAVVSARRTRMAVQLGHTADRGLEPRVSGTFVVPAGCLRAFLARWRPRRPHLLRAFAEVPRHGRPCSSPASVFWNAAVD